MTRGHNGLCRGHCSLNH